MKMKELLLNLGKGGEQLHCPKQLLPQDKADFKFRSQRKCIVKAEQDNRDDRDNTEWVKCVNGINKEFIQIDSLFLITHNPASSLLQAELKTKTAASLIVWFPEFSTIWQK